MDYGTLLPHFADDPQKRISRYRVHSVYVPEITSLRSTFVSAFEIGTPGTWDTRPVAKQANPLENTL